MAPLQAEKQAVRATVRVRRAEAARTTSDAGEAATAVFRRTVRLRPGTVAAGYLPIGDEIDPRPLLRWLRGAGHAIVLPRIVRTGGPLAFRGWDEGDTLEDGPFGTLQPADAAPELVPEVLIMPMLAFDRRGFRLGYGGGYYDRTLAVLRGRRAVTAIGIAFAVQEVPVVPADRHDQPLDWVVTEREAIETKKED
jgi:5-formyltetrahydrofolate cyclo-ligase